jgi:Putative DNA-binding domain
MNENDLLARLLSGRSSETSFVERKPGSVNKTEIRREACAFANSTPEPEESVIFVGVHDKTGKPTGIENMESLQKKIREALRMECYPPIAYMTREMPYEGETVLAVVIPSSELKPHFTGPAYVREGSSTRNASEDVFKDLVLSQVDKCREIVRHKNKGLVSVSTIDYKLGDKQPMRRPYVARAECIITDCTGHVVKLYQPATGYTYTESLTGVEIGYDDEKRRLLLIVRFPS